MPLSPSCNWTPASWGGEEGALYVASVGFPHALFVMDTEGTSSPDVLATGPPLASLNGFITRAPNGDLIVADSGADMIYRVTTPGGLVSQFLSSTELQSCVGQPPDLIGGIAFDDRGDFYLAEENTDSIYKVDTDLNCSLFVSEAEMEEAKGEGLDIDVDLKGGICFAQQRRPVGGVIRPPVSVPVSIRFVALIGLVSSFTGAALFARRRPA